MAKRTKKAGAVGDESAAASASVANVKAPAVAAKARKTATAALKQPKDHGDAAPKAPGRRRKAAPVPDEAETAGPAPDTHAPDAPAPDTHAHGTPAPDTHAPDTHAPDAPSAGRRLRGKGAVAAGAAQDDHHDDAAPDPQGVAPEPDAPAIIPPADEARAQPHPASHAVPDDADAGPDSAPPAQPPDAEKQARKAARQAERQAAREAERSAAKAARQAERQAAQAARKAARRNPRHSPPAPDGAPSDQTRPARTADAAPRTADAGAPALDFDVLIVAQGGGIDREAAILAASLRRNAPGFRGRLVVAEPQPGGAWDGTDPRMGDDTRAALTALGADIRPLEARDFGRSYPHGNKIEALRVLDPARPFLFLDSDTLVLGDLGRVPFDFSRPSASMRRSGTWPQPPAYNETYASIWRSLYDRFGLDFDATLDRSQPDEHWERFLYFNAGWFFGADPAEFRQRFRDWAVAVRDDPGEPLACQSLDPWLDQVILPLVIHSLGGGRPGPELHGMDGGVTCHWRNLPLLYAREADRALDEMEAVAATPEIAPLMAGWEPAERLIGMGQGRRRIRPMFWADDPPQPEHAIRHRLRQAGFWLV